MLVFWRHGYSGTSLADLVEATGLGRQSLYNTFGDKNALFTAVLQHYQTRFADSARDLAEPTAGLKELKRFMLGVIAQQRTHQCGACMIVKTAFDFQLRDEAIQAVVSRAAQGTRKVFADLVRRAQARGEVDPERDPTTLANYLFSTFNGLSSLAQTGAEDTEIKQALDLALEAIRPK